MNYRSWWFNVPLGTIIFPAFIKLVGICNLPKQSGPREGRIDHYGERNLESWWRRADGREGRDLKWVLSDEHSQTLNPQDTQITKQSACQSLLRVCVFMMNLVKDHCSPNDTVCDWSNFAFCDSCIDNEADIRIASFNSHDSRVQTNILHLHCSADVPFTCFCSTMSTVSY